MLLWPSATASLDHQMDPAAVLVSIFRDNYDSKDDHDDNDVDDEDIY